MKTMKTMKIKVRKNLNWKNKLERIWL